MSEKLVIIDGSGFIFRAYHALPPLTRSDGTPVGALYGFCSMLIKFMHDQSLSKRIAVVFDASRKTFRHDIYPDYKANRPPVPEDLIPQFPLFREACKAFNLPFIEMEGYEADDIIASYADYATKNNLDAIIVSGDKDLMQLMSTHVSLYDPMKNKEITKEDVLAKFGVDPSKMIEVQSLIGDSSDNVPGVPSIGPKTAAELINAFQTLEGIYEHISEIKQPKRKEALLLNKDKAYISKKLVTLVTTVPLPLTFEELCHKPVNPKTAEEFLKEQGFFSLIKRLLTPSTIEEVLKEKPSFNAIVQEAIVPIKKEIQTDYQLITTKDALKNWLCDAKFVLAIDTETNSLSIPDATLVGISLAKEEGKACYIPLQHQSIEQATLFDRSPKLLHNQISLNDLKEILLPYLNDDSVLKVGHNLKFDKGILKKVGLDFQTFDDTMLLSYVLDGGKHRHGLDALAKLYFDHDMISFSDVAGVGKKQVTFDFVNIEKAKNYAAEDADFTLRLYNVLKPRLLKEKQETLYHTIEKPIVSVVQLMEENGILLDQEKIKKLEKEFSKAIEDVALEIYNLAGHEFNIGSPKQLSEVLFEEQNLPRSKKSKTGAHTTDIDVLEELALQGHLIAEKIIEWRSLSKLQSTYVEGLLKSVSPTTNRIHTSYHLAGTNTGRFSSSDPNLQNIPVRSEDGKKIRSCFIAKPDHILVSFDYSQIELRLLAHLAAIESLQEAFKNNMDIHKLTASQIFNVPLEEVSSDLRRHAKAINFGIIYGISPFGLSQQLKIPQSDAKRYISAYFERYPGIQEFMETQKEFARKNGYVETLMKRRCYTPGIHDKSATMRQFAERQAINAPLQGSNADIIKKAMIEVAMFLENQKALLLLQVHDELVVEMHKDVVNNVCPRIKNIMESSVQLSIPLKVDVGIGKNWAEAH